MGDIYIKTRHDQPRTGTGNKCDNFEIVMKSGNEEQREKQRQEKKSHPKKVIQESGGQTVAICFELQKRL